MSKVWKNSSLYLERYSKETFNRYQEKLITYYTAFKNSNNSQTFNLLYRQTEKFLTLINLSPYQEDVYFLLKDYLFLWEEKFLQEDFSFITEKVQIDLSKRNTKSPLTSYNFSKVENLFNSLTSKRAKDIILQKLLETLLDTENDFLEVLIHSSCEMLNSYEYNENEIVTKLYQELVKVIHLHSDKDYTLFSLKWFYKEKYKNIDEIISTFQYLKERIQTEEWKNIFPYNYQSYIHNTLYHSEWTQKEFLLKEIDSFININIRHPFWLDWPFRLFVYKIYLKLWQINNIETRKKIISCIFNRALSNEENWFSFFGYSLWNNFYSELEDYNFSDDELEIIVEKWLLLLQEYDLKLDTEIIDLDEHLKTTENYDVFVKQLHQLSYKTKYEPKIIDTFVRLYIF